MDTSGKFGEALMDLGNVHSILITDEVSHDAGATEDSGVHPAGRTSKGMPLWEVLRSAGAVPLSNMSLNTVHVRMSF